MAASVPLIRLHPDGSLDETFQVEFSGNSFISTFAVQNDGAILVAGFFTAIDGVARTRLARLHPNGRLDTSFNPPALEVAALLSQPDGKVVIGGAGLEHGVVRLLANGALDPTFKAATSALNVRALA